MSILNVNQLQPVGGGNTITVGSSNIDYSGSITGNISVDGNLTVTGVVSHEDVTNIDSVGVVTARSGLHVITGSVGIGTDNPSNLLHVHGQSRFEDYLRGNSTHNKLYIADDVAITATKKLYFDGGSNTYIDEVSADTLRFSTAGTGRLRITSGGNIGIGDTTPENALTIKNIGSFEGDANSFYFGSNFTGTGQNYTGTNKHAQRFFFNNAASNGYLRYENTGTTGNAGDAITWQERLRITSAGRLLVGGSTSTRSTFFNSSSWTPQVQIENNTDQKSSLSLICSHATNNQAGLLALGATKSSSLGGNGLTGSSQGLGIITFQGNDGSQMVEAARIQCVAAGTPSADNMPGELRFSVNSGSSGATEKLRILSSGGITFNGDTAAANALDDYEEGTFTPSLTFATPGTSSFSYSVQSGWYTKIGRMVHYRLELRLTAFSKGTASGDLRVSGLPFTTANFGAGQFTGSFGAFYAPLPTSAGHFPFFGARLNSTEGFFKVLRNNNSWDVFPDPDSNSQYKCDVTVFTI